jgi:hypothetical protein
MSGLKGGNGAHRDHAYGARFKRGRHVALRARGQTRVGANEKRTGRRAERRTLSGRARSQGVRSMRSMAESGAAARGVLTGISDLAIEGERGKVAAVWGPTGILTLRSSAVRSHH